MSVVYLAHQSRPSRDVAVKILLPKAPVGSSLHNEFLARFQSEADIIAKLEHIHIIPIFECGEQDGLAYLVMPYLTGGSLRDVLVQRGSLSLQETLTYIEQAAQALDYAHTQGVIHRDLKPGNFLLYADGRLVLADFGIARIVQGNHNFTYSTLTNTGILLGTPEYMAPEMVLGRQIDARADIYELGIVLFQMLTGDLPFKGRTPYEVIEKHLEQSPPFLHQLNPHIPPTVDAVIHKATAKKPADRFESAGALAQALRAAITTPYYPTIAVSYNTPLVLSSSSTTTPGASQLTEYARRPVNEHLTSQYHQTTAKTSHNRPRRSPFWLVLLGMVMLIAFASISLLLVGAHAPKDTRIQTPAQTPQVQAKAVVNEFYSDLNKWNYPAAFSLLSSGNYCSFVDGYAHTIHDDISIGKTTKNSDGTIRVDLTIQALEKLSQGTVTTTYQAYETVGQENGAWKIQGGGQNVGPRVPTPEPPLVTSPAPTPPQEAQALVQQFYDDINNQNYPAAYNRWGTNFQNNTDYCTFIGNYTNTLHYDVSIQNITTLPDGTLQVVSLVDTTSADNTTHSTHPKTYIVGPENNTWKILSGTLP